MIGVDVKLYTASDRETAPRGGTAVSLSGVPRGPGGQRAPRLPSREPLRSAECQPVRRGKRGAGHLRRAPLQDVSRLVAHLLGDGCERGALHLAQLDAQQLQKVAVGGGGGGAPPPGGEPPNPWGVQTERAAVPRPPPGGGGGAQPAGGGGWRAPAPEYSGA